MIHHLFTTIAITKYVGCKEEVRVQTTCMSSREQVGIMLSQCRRMRCVSAHRQHRRVNSKLNLGTSALDLPSYFDWKSDPPH